MFFVANILLTQSLKSQKFDYPIPNLKYQLKNKYQPLAKNFTKGYHSVVTLVLYHFCDMSLIADCEIFCTCSFFGDTIWHCWHWFLVSNISVSHALEMTITFITQPLSCFAFHVPNLLLTQNFVYTTLFSSVPPPPPPPPPINNDRSFSAKLLQRL
jgi:hypothetical protein